ncbi:MAG: FAD-dependent oxidoreductase [Syntrophobacteraceae bacterium]|nr:FAD-dependent oxidoreductase [Syntrophobacteraceae bacterium]
MAETKNQQAGEAHKTGAVAIVGGGIAGIQSALDIAGSGFKVYLIEQQPNVGGVMSQLDKTFPTNDCSSCMMGPKLVELANHRNIKILTRTTVEKLEGVPGNFSLTVKRHPRYVLEDKCTGCGECARVCPIDLPSGFDQGLNTRKAIYRNYPQAVPPAFAIDKLDGSPCTNACPGMVNGHAYVTLIARGRYQDAMKVIMRNLPLPGVLGRICPHPCETACRRATVDEPVSICTLKRFVADAVDPEKLPLPDREMKRESVAIVGSGPAGLTAAYFLALEGYGVTIYESLGVAGGMLRVGIPDYRLPPEMLDKEIRAITRLGVEIKYHSALGRDFTLDELFGRGHKAVYLAIGAHRGVKLSIQGEDTDGVMHGVDFLRAVNLYEMTDLKGKRVVVVGGGDVAIDAARSALRTGAAKVSIFYRRTRGEMPAHPNEIEDGLAEGIEIKYLVSPRQVVAAAGKVAGLRCVGMELGEPDASGRRSPIPVPGSEFVEECDIVVAAIGQTPDSLFLSDSEKVRITRFGTIKVDGITYQTSREGVFAGGDAQSGPWIAIGAVAAGREAAISISRYLKGEDMAVGRKKTETAGENFSPIPPDVKRTPRLRRTSIPMEQRKSGFSEVEPGITEEQARAEASRCLDCMICCECRMCEEACLAGAIAHDMGPVTEKIEAGAVILSPGFEVFDPKLKPEYGWGRWPNVVTSLEYERILSAAGPFSGHIQRLSDGKKPARIAWIQCVGSRDSAIGRDYCSYVCCMYATKQAMITKEHEADIDTTIFYIDIRAQGKGFDRFYERAKNETGVRYVRSMISRIVPVVETGGLLIDYCDENEVMREEEFDMVVLSVGLCAHPSTVGLARRLGVDLDPFAFIKTGPLDMVSTSRPGVYVCGAAQGPKDIPDSVLQGSSAAARATSLLSGVRGELIEPPPHYEERDVRGEKVRIGVFVCHCGINIAGVVDTVAVADYAKTLPGVEYAFSPMFACSTDQQKEIKRAIGEYKLNRFVVASCTPRTHEPLFRNTLREAGLNPYLFELANIREQDSWVHQGAHERATAKAKDLVRMAVARAALLEPLHDFSCDVVQKALVIGGGLAGLTAALAVAEQGFPAVLVEKTSELGGHAGKLFYTEDGGEPSKYVQTLIEAAESNRLIEIYRQAEVLEVKGSCGNFSTRIAVGGKSVEFSHGVAIIAVGGCEYKPSEYLYDRDGRVVTQNEFERMLAKEPASAQTFRNITMIQCVGSREPEHSYCSRVCCTAAVKNSLKLKEINPSANVSVLYRDIRTFGLKELQYREARRAGVRFFRFDQDLKPEVRIGEAGLDVLVFDSQLGRGIVLKTDLLVLSSAIRPGEDAKKLAETLRLPLDQDGFFLEAHPKLRPLDFATSGFFLCGLAHGPKFADESISQARGAVSRAMTILSQKEIVVAGVVTEVDPNLCRACGECEQTCLFGAIKVSEVENGKKRAVVNRALCTGCGACSAACPTGAASLAHFRDSQIEAMIRACQNISNPG